jgi:hypothetical protein
VTDATRVPQIIVRASAWLRVGALVSGLTLGCGSGTQPLTVQPDDASSDDASSLDDVGQVEAAPRADTGGETPKPLGGLSSTTLIVEPDDGTAPILAVIAAAKRSVHLEVYLLSDDAVVGALTAASSLSR